MTAGVGSSVFGSEKWRRKRYFSLSSLLLLLLTKINKPIPKFNFQHFLNPFLPPFKILFSSEFFLEVRTLWIIRTVWVWVCECERERDRSSKMPP